MKIWIVTIYEPLPLMDPSVRPMRCGMMVKSLHKAGHEVELWTSAFDHIQHRYIENSSCIEKIVNGVTLQYIWGCGYTSDISPKRWFHFRKLAKEFKRIAESKTEKPDLIITQIPSLELAEAVVDYGKDYLVPVIVDIRDPWPDVYLRILTPSIRKYFQWLVFLERKRLQKILRMANAVIAVSKTYLSWGLEQVSRKELDIDKVFYIGYPELRQISGDYDRDRLNFYKKCEIKDKDFIILFSGTFCGASDYDWSTVVKVLKKISVKYNENIKLIIAGKGDNEGGFKRLIRNLANIKFIGWLESKELSLLLSIANLGILPFANRAQMSLSNKPFEYMAAGLPLLNSLKGELWSLIHENKIGKCYEAGNVGQLYDAICWFIEHPGETRKMGENARKLFENNFTESKIYNNFVKHVEFIHNSYISNKQLRKPT